MALSIVVLVWTRTASPQSGNFLSCRNFLRLLLSSTLILPGIFADPLKGRRTDFVLRHHLHHCCHQCIQRTPGWEKCDQSCDKEGPNMRPFQLWLPSVGYSLKETAADQQRAFAAWLGESRVWLLPWAEEPVRWPDKATWWGRQLAVP